MLNEMQLKALLTETHKAIEQSSENALWQLRTGNTQLSYPPNGDLTDDEKQAIESINLNPTLASALRKIFASAAASPLFCLFGLMDGVGDPDNYDGLWLGCRLQPVMEGDTDAPYQLHDEFYASYWDWRKIRPDPGWKLDNLPNRE